MGAVTALSIHAEVAARDVHLDVDLPVGEVCGIVGPNGAGKSTLLQLLAGLVVPSSGTVSIGGREVAGPTTHEPPHRRRAVLLTQDAALFPHLDVLANVAFGPRAAGVSASSARARALTELDAVGCADLAGRRPHQLSGGQAQRVALARALATDPDVVLLDEPLAGLDVAVAADVRHSLAERLRGRTALLVTHEVLDLWTIASRVVVLEGGRVAETGTVADLMARPTSTFLARLGGTNLLTGTSEGTDVLHLAAGLTLRGLADPDQPPHDGQPGLATVAPAAVSLHLTPPGGSPRNHLVGTITGLAPRGDTVRVGLDIAGQALAADLTPQSVAELKLTPGLAVTAVVKATQVRLYGR